MCVKTSFLSLYFLVFGPVRTMFVLNPNTKNISVTSFGPLLCYRLSLLLSLACLHLLFLFFQVSESPAVRFTENLMFLLGQQLQILYGTVLKIYELETGNFSAVPINVFGALIKKGL